MSIFNIGGSSQGSGGIIGPGNPTSSAVNTQAGDLLVVWVGWSAVTLAAPVISDLAGNGGSFTAGTPANQGSTFRSQMFYRIGALADAANVITADLSANTAVSFSVLYVWSIPLSGTAVFDIDAIGNSSGLSNNPSTATFNTTGTDELVLGAAANDFSGITYTAGSGYTLDSASFGSGVGGSEHELFSSTQTGIVADFSQSGNTDWVINAIAFKESGGGGGTTVNVVHNIDADIQVDASKTHNIDADIFVPPAVDETHNIDVYILVTSLLSFVKLAGTIYPRIVTPQGFVRFNSTLAAQQLSFVKLNALIKATSEGYVDLAGTIQVITRNYVRLAGNISSDKLKTHNIDAAIAVNELSYVQIFGTIVAKIEPGPCMSFPDASYVKLAAWMVIPGDSKQMPNSGFSLADDFLSSQTALQAYKPMSLISLAGFNLIVTAFTAGVYSWQTRARTWLTRQDEAGSGILLTTTVNTHTLPNGAVITTTTQVKLVQDVQVTIVTIQNSATPERTSVIVTEKNQFGQTVTRESDTTNINGTINTLTKRTVYTQPPTNDNIQPITVRTLDGVQHYQFFSQQNTEWAGGDAEGVTQTQTQQQIIPSSLNGKTQDQFGNPILARINDTIENDPTGKLIHTHTEEVGIRDVGTTTTDTQDSFNGITETTIVTTTYPDGSQEVRKSVKNSITGDTSEVSTETVTDEYGQITTTVTNTETKTFVDPITGVLRTLITKTVNVTKSGVNTVDTTVVSTDNFEDSIVNDKIKVISIQEFTIACVIDEFTMFGLWEVNESHQKQYALQELFGQQLGNANLTYALRQRLIQQFNAANCVPCVNLQANGRTWCVVFAPSASAFRPKLIMGTEPHVYELQLIVQARSNLIDGTVGF